MSISERLIKAVGSQFSMRSDVDRAVARIERLSDSLFDHEKRLIRLETLVEVARGEFGSRRLPPA